MSNIQIPQFISDLMSPELAETSCSWWSLSTSIQKKMQKLIPDDQTSWTWTCYKNSDGTWGFDIPALLTFNEKFMNGTELCLDKWFTTLSGKSPKTGSKMEMTISSKELADSTTILTYTGDDEGIFDYGKSSMKLASYYLCQETKMTLWLCQYLQFLFKEKPKKMWLKLELK